MIKLDFNMQLQILKFNIINSKGPHMVNLVTNIGGIAKWKMTTCP